MVFLLKEHGRVYSLVSVGHIVLILLKKDTVAPKKEDFTR
jgi:hypothetical protein